MKRLFKAVSGALLVLFGACGSAFAQVDGPVAKFALSKALPAYNATLGTANPICQDGDSRTANGIATGTLGSAPNQNVFNSKTNYGFGWWTEYLTNRAVYFPVAGNFGIGGQTSANVLANLPANAPKAVSLGCKYVVLLIGTNDVAAGATAASIETNILAIEQAYLSAGVQVVSIAEMPRGDTQATPNGELTSGQQQVMFSLHSWLLSQAGTIPGLYVIDFWPLFADPSSTNGYVVPGADAVFGGLHETQTGGYLGGTALAVFFNQRFPNGFVLPSSNGDLFNASTNPLGAINANPLMLGIGTSDPTSYGHVTPTGGTLSVAYQGAVFPCSASGTTLTTGTPTAGTIAIGQQIYGNFAASGTTITAGSGTSWTITPSQTLGSFTCYTIGGVQPVYTLGGTPTGTPNWYVARQFIALNSGYLLAGKTIRLIGKWGVAANAIGLQGCDLEMQVVNSAVGTYWTQSGQPYTGPFWPAAATIGTASTDNYTIKAADTGMYADLRCYGTQNVPNSFVVTAYGLELQVLN